MITRIRTALAGRRESRRAADEARVLAALERHPLVGYDLIQRTRLGSGRLYVALARLERRRWIARTWRGERVYYGLPPRLWIDGVDTEDP